MQNDHPPNDPRKLLPLKIALYAGFAVGALVLACVLALLLFHDPLVNRFIKPRIIQAFAEAYPAYSMRVADMNYNVLQNRFGFDSVALSAVDGTFSSNMGPFFVSGISWMHLLWGQSLAPNDFANSAVDAQNIALNFPQEQYELRCGLLCMSVPDSEIVLEALKLHPSGEDEEFVAGSKLRKTGLRLLVPHARVRGLACLELLQGKMYRIRSGQINKDKLYAKDTSSPPMPNEILSSDFGNAVVDAQDIVLNFPQEQYELRCGMLRVSVPDSEIIIDTLKFHPSVGDEQLFAASKFRKTRFRLVVLHAGAMGVACVELLRGNMYSTRSAQIHDAFLDVLINKDKSFATDASVPPVMPNELLSSIRGTLRVDSLSIVNGRLKYGERFAVGAEPALITFDNMQVLVKGIANHGHPGAAVVIHADGIFMKAGMMNLHMSIPVSSPEFSFEYSGSLGDMDLSALNGFLETAEQMRIKEGDLQEATFEINVASGRARGNVQAVYNDLTLAAINKQTGSEKGFADGIASFIANTFQIRGTNDPEESGSIKIGEVKHKRRHDEFFFEFAWVALRSGVGDVVGF